MRTSQKRGHKTVIKNVRKLSNGSWTGDEFYANNLESTDIERSCKKCGRMPTKEGYDACLGKLPNVKFACCGHGIEERSIMYDNA